MSLYRHTNGKNMGRKKRRGEKKSTRGGEIKENRLEAEENE